jgi:short-subunit dehydrogenase
MTRRLAPLRPRGSRQAPNCGGERLIRRVGGEDRLASRKDQGSLVAIVTGASSGIGRALAVQLGAAGYRVGLIARRAVPLDATAAVIVSAGGTAFAAVADVGDRRALHSAIESMSERLGPVDVMVANAGFGAPTRLDPLNTADVEQTIRVNVMGVIYSIEAVLPGMLERGRGHLLAVSSLAAFKGLPGESAYCASKAAVNAYLEGLRISLRKQGITVTTICPGFVQTEMTPMESSTPFIMPAEAAAARIMRAIAKRKGGVVSFPLPTALLSALSARMPDAIVASFMNGLRSKPPVSGPKSGAEGPAR